MRPHLFRCFVRYDAAAFRLNPPSKLHSLGPERLKLVAAVFEAYEQTLREENISAPDRRPMPRPSLLTTP